MRVKFLSCVALLPGLAFGGEGKVVGKLGQTIEELNIHATTSPKSRVYFRTKKFQYLVINTAKQDGWLKVLLLNGRYGYVQADKVARLPYDVRVKATPDPESPTVAMSNRTGNTTSRTGSSKQQMLDYSFNFIGTPYKWGGNDLQRGIDCSGFVKKLFGQIGVDLPRTARQQALVGTPVNRLEELQPGDRLYFWDSKRGYIGHTGIFLGFRDDHAFFIHSSSGRRGVNTDDLAQPKWRRMLVAARRD
ncbi:MAG: C40 family peptidase [Chthonomonadaceae bacterium]|jgi:cell wall-associated NlpC family hydrolase|nr:C40 family peptidase [Chthonomonadaceae bacterium]